MTQDQQQKKAAGHDPNREHMTLSELWQLWRDNLMSWRSFCDEHHDLFTLNIQAGFRRIGRWLSDLRSNARALAAANRDRRFPESEYGAAQLFLFFRGSLERRAAAIREGFSNRRKALTWMGGKRRHFFEKMHLHPVAFLCGAMAIAAAATVLSLYTLGAQVTYDGQDLGIVSSRRAAEKVVAELEDVTRATTGDGGYTVDTALLTAETGVFPRRELISDDEFEETLSDTLGVVDYAYVLYVDGEKVVATTRSGALEDLLEQLKLGYETADTVNAYFVEDVDIRQEYVESSYVMNLGYIAEILNETKEGEVTYTVTSGDSYYSIAEKYDLSVEALMKLNSGYDPKILRVGDVLTISNAVPYLTVVNVERQRYVQDVPYQVEYTDDSSMYQGEYKVTSPGVYGKADMTANVTYINGEETEREVVASVTLSQPVTEQQLRGTKERPTWYPTGSFSWPCTGILTSRFGYRSLLGSTYHSGIDIGNSYGTSIYASDGGFAWPCNGVLTSRFGYRSLNLAGASSYHRGIDIGNSYGTSIYASDGGTVTYSGWMSGYGYLIIIDHGNGYQTYYGHNSSLVASLGQKVHKGQLIARMGSTGRSTGNHCHFGIKLNGTFVNPLNYL